MLAQHMLSTTQTASATVDLDAPSLYLNRTRASNTPCMTQAQAVQRWKQCMTTPLTPADFQIEAFTTLTVCLAVLVPGRVLR
jgi:hypothetical protein